MHSIRPYSLVIWILTCTLNKFRQGRPFPDPVVRTFDMRQFRSLAPISFQLGPAFINVLPRRQSSIVVTSHEGVVNIVDANDHAATEYYQVSTRLKSGS